MKILLIYPPRENYIFGVTPHVYIEADAGNYPPIGMLYIASYLKNHSKNVGIKVLDACTEQYTHEQVKGFIDKEKPDIVGIYFSTYYLNDGIIVAKSVKQLNAKTLVIAGGPHVMLYPEETIKLPEIDYVMAGEGEHSFTELVECIAENRVSDISKISNIWSKKSNYSKPLTRGREEDIDSLPYPARELLSVNKYKSILAKRNPITTVITSRGCPFKCLFCSNIESGQKVRYRSAVNVVNELQYLHNNYQITDFLLFDELFTSNRQRAMDICNEILRRGLKIRWHCRSRADVLDKEMVVLMKKAGCRLIQFGIETGNPRLQQLINKKLVLDEVRKTIAMVYDAGIYTYADFMFGLPTETEEETKITLEYAKSLKLDYIAFGMFHPIPGSVFYQQGLDENKFTDFWREFVNNPTIPMEDHSWTRKDRTKFHDFMSYAYQSFYIRPSYMFSHLFRLDSFNQLVWQVKAAFRVFSQLILKRYK
ncbi:MAG: radical SAM protein [Elusimicrobiota bacterium]